MALDDTASQAKRTVLRMIPYGLYVVTAKGDDGTTNGFTANWVTQAGFDPPMVALGIANDAYTLQLIRSGKRYAISVMEEGNRDLLRRLARPHFKAPDKLENLELSETESGTPVVADSLGYLELELRGELQYGSDHQLIVGEVVDAEVHREGQIQTMQAAGMKYSG